jgi:tRNA U34 5-methylaminomethyl-2-thiouridine-forming methyltransferase MnmC
MPPGRRQFWLILPAMHHIIETGDGSHSLLVPGWNVTYHSRFGAVAESRHVFIESGLKHILLRRPLAISVLEMGFGTGLNALLTLIETQLLPVRVHYEALETEPLEPSISSALNYCAALNRPEMQALFNELHESAWNLPQIVSTGFELFKRREDITDVSFRNRYDLVYFDAFDPATQPGVWTQKIFKKIFDVMNDNAVLVTYCSKGSVRRAMQDAGLIVEKLAGPKGKREIVRATKK